MPGPTFDWVPLVLQLLPASCVQQQTPMQPCAQAARASGLLTKNAGTISTVAKENSKKTIKLRRCMRNLARFIIASANYSIKSQICAFTAKIFEVKMTKVKIIKKIILTSIILTFWFRLVRFRQLVPFVFIATTVGVMPQVAGGDGVISPEGRNLYWPPTLERFLAALEMTPHNCGIAPRRSGHC